MNNERSIEDELDEVLKTVDSGHYRGALEHLDMIERVMQEHPDSQDKLDRTKRSLLEKVASGLDARILLALETAEGGLADSNPIYEGFGTSLTYLRAADQVFGLDLCPSDMRDYFKQRINNVREMIHTKAVQQLDALIETAVQYASNGFLEVKYTESRNGGKPGLEIARAQISRFALRAGSALEIMNLARLYFCHKGEPEIDSDMEKRVQHGIGRAYIKATEHSMITAKEHSAKGNIVNTVAGFIDAMRIAKRADSEADQKIQVRTEVMENTLLAAYTSFYTKLKGADEKKVSLVMASYVASDDYINQIKNQLFDGEPQLKFAQRLHVIADNIIKEVNDRRGIITPEKPRADAPPPPPEQALRVYRPTVIGISPGRAPPREKK